MDPQPDDVLILIVGETATLASLATNDHRHADVAAGSMAAGVAAILIAAALGTMTRREPGAAA